MKDSKTITNSTLTRVYRFGNCYLDKVERKVFKNNKNLDISSRAFDILQLLIERQGESVSKDELLEEIWNDSFVEEGNLPVYVSKLRKQLGATKDEPFIETVSGVGYRFVSRVEQIKDDEWLKLKSNDNKAITVNDEGSVRTDSIAVLPLVNENGDEELDYLADGITESLINILSYIPNLRVIARNTVFQYKNKKNIDINTVSNELHVQNILTGRIRVIRNKLVISVELTNTTDGSQIWGTRLNRPIEDIFEVQKEITKTIWDKLEPQIGERNKQTSDRNNSDNPESYRHYLKGKYFQNVKTPENIHKSIDYFQQSISLDPINANSYVELANSYRLLYVFDQITRREALDQISPLLNKATELNASIYEIYILKGCVQMYMEFEFERAESNFIKALELNSNSLLAHSYYSKLLTFTGRFSKALHQTNECVKLSPISTQNIKRVSKIFYCMEQFENSLLKAEESLELMPDDYEALLMLGNVLSELNRYDDALDAFRKSMDSHYFVETLSMIGYVNAKAKRFDEVKKILKQLKDEAKSRYVPTYYLGHIYTALGETDNAFNCLDLAYEDKYLDLISLKVDPRYKSIRNDPRFNEMLSKVGLPID